MTTLALTKGNKKDVSLLIEIAEKLGLELKILEKKDKKSKAETEKSMFYKKWAGAFKPISDEGAQSAKDEYLSRKHK